MQKFIYNANGIAISGRITRPIDHSLAPQGVCVLPACGGSVSSRAPAFSLSDPQSGRLLFSYSSAEMSIDGSESATGVRKTVLLSTVRDINVANVLKADEVTIKLTLEYDLAADRVSIGTEESRYVNLTIDGQLFDVTVDHAMAHQAADYETFRKNHPEHPEKRGKIHYALGRHPLLKFDETGHGYHHHPDFGRVYFGEWHAAPYTQQLTMLRLELGSPQAGDLWLGGGGGNGNPPPTSGG
jgi:hypothetical protein